MSSKVVGLGVASVGCCSFGSSVEFAECMGGASSEGFCYSFPGFVVRAPLSAGLLGRCSCAPRTSFWWCGVVVGVDSSCSGGHASPQVKVFSFDSPYCMFVLRCNIGCELFCSYVVRGGTLGHYVRHIGAAYWTVVCVSWGRLENFRALFEFPSSTRNLGFRVSNCFALMSMV